MYYFELIQRRALSYASRSRALRFPIAACDSSELGLLVMFAGERGVEHLPA